MLIGVAAVVVSPHLKASTADASTANASLITERLAPIPEPSKVSSATSDAVDEPAIEVKTQPALPADSGEGKRIVFDQSDQRVWLVDSDGGVERTYLVSGSKFDNLQPGDYKVQSKQRHATAFDYSGTMEYFVRFATGYSEPIGFHTVPKDNNGQLEQTKQQLGTPLSAGCVRQWPDDAIALWDFAPVGTPVVVVA